MMARETKTPRRGHSLPMQPKQHLRSLALAAAALLGVGTMPTWLGCADEAISIGEGEGSVDQGNGGSGGGSVAATSGTWNLDQTGCPASWEPLFEPAPPSCDHPSEDPCYWQMTDGWIACSCGCTTEAHWDCYSNMAQPGCPLTEPVNGSACDGKDGFTCPYFPGRRCDCDPYEHVWSCDLDWVIADGETQYPCFDPTP